MLRRRASADTCRCEEGHGILGCGFIGVLLIIIIISAAEDEVTVASPLLGFARLAGNARESATPLPPPPLAPALLPWLTHRGTSARTIVNNGGMGVGLEDRQPALPAKIPSFQALDEHTPTISLRFSIIHHGRHERPLRGRPSPNSSAPHRIRPACNVLDTPI